MIKRIASRFFSAVDLFDYVTLLGRRLLFGMVLVGYLISPVVALRYREFLSLRPFRWFLVVWALGLVLFEGVVSADLIHPPVVFWRNTLVNFGVGPVLLKGHISTGNHEEYHGSRPHCSTSLSFGHSSPLEEFW